MLLKLISTRIIPYRTIPKALSFSFETVNKTDQIKKHQELNTKLKDYRDTHKFTLANPSQKAVKFISDSQKIKQIKEIKVLFEDFLQKGLDNLNEKQFIELITKISQSVTNEIVLKDPKFEIMIKKYAFKLSSFKDTRNACFFICFCSISNLNYPDIWDYFKSYLLNMQEKMSVESKCMILVNYMPINEKCFVFYINKQNIDSFI